jgi:hypothetical protein
MSPPPPPYSFTKQAVNAAKRKIQHAETLNGARVLVLALEILSFSGCWNLEFGTFPGVKKSAHKLPEFPSAILSTPP